MSEIDVTRTIARLSLFVLAAAMVAGCGGTKESVRTQEEGETAAGYEYIIGPGDRLDVFVWRNPDVSVEDIPVGPDGRISTPLVRDMVAAGKTPAQLARDIEGELARYIRSPTVTVTVVDFVGRYAEQVRVVGAAATPRALAYRDGMTVLDVMIAVGGLTEFAAGNKATLITREDGGRKEIRLRLRDLIQQGDISANLAVRPGDILIIPEARF